MTRSRFFWMGLGVLFWCGVLPAVGQDVKAGNLQIEEPRLRAMLPGAKVGGGDLIIVNQGQTADKLLSISTDRAKSVQIHSMTMDNGVMVMREVKDGLDIAAGQTFDMKSGGYHLMFMGVAQPFKQGETVKARLIFQKAGPVEVEFPVGSAKGG